MIKPHRLLIIFLLITASPLFAQKLKKADRIISENYESHVKFLSDQKLEGRVAGSAGERAADEYIIGQFKKNGLKPSGDSNSWMQKFAIADGKDIAGTSVFMLNGKPLTLNSEYFPLAMSGSNRVEASVSVALAEAGMPWFVDLKELLDDNEDSTRLEDTTYLIGARARRAAAKGATALIVYNNSVIRDIVFDGLDSVLPATIPVVYISSAGVKKHMGKEPSILDVKMNIAMKDRLLDGRNVVGYADNAADSTVVVAAHLDSETDVAALIELSRILKARQYRFLNYLFVVYTPEKKGRPGINYFNDHPVLNLQRVNDKLNLDTMESKGLPAIKESIVAINALKRK